MVRPILMQWNASMILMLDSELVGFTWNNVMERGHDDVSIFHHHQPTMQPTMAATQEELLGLMDPPAAHPTSIFLNHPLTINGDSQMEKPRDGLALASISRML